MNRRKYIYILAVGLFFCSSAIAQKSKVKIVSGSQDRAFHVKMLYKIAYPVIHNLANETLKKNMPLEQAPKYYNNAKEVAYTEALGRTFAGIAPWLSLPDDATDEGKLRKSFRDETIKALTNAVNPKSADYINFRTNAQPIVDAAYVVQGFLRAPNIWAALDETTKSRYVEEIKSLRNRTGAYNNWLLFTGLEEAWLLSIGEQYDPFRTNIAVKKLNEWYAGDGWYKDGESFSMDYYNAYVINPMMVDLMQVLVEKKKAKQSDLDRAVERLARFGAFSERCISPEGTYPPLGRSVTYRTAAFQALAQAALLNKLPKELAPAQVRCALTKVFYNMFNGNQNFDKNGWLVLGFNGHQPEVADPYTVTGSLYMATLGFLALGLPANDKFWTDPAASWTSQKAWEGKTIVKDHSIEN